MTPIKNALDNIKTNNEKAQEVSTLKSFLLYLIDIISVCLSDLKQGVTLHED